MKVVYLLGAGASYNGVPIVEHIPGELKNLIEDLKTNENYQLDGSIFGNFQYTNTQALEELISSMEWMLEQTNGRHSIDTVAQGFNQRQNRDDLDRIKRALSAFFLLNQAKRTPDKRYDNFLSAIIENRVMPSNFRILSWNYDLQFEMTAEHFTGIKDLKSNQEFLNVVSKYSTRNPKEGFKLFKLNGSTGFYMNKGFRYSNSVDRFEGELTKEIVDSIARGYAICRHTREVFSGLSFSWERDDNPIVDRACEEISDAEVLVVIGYSFPDMNTRIDKRFLKHMPHLQRVIIQDPNAHITAQRFKDLEQSHADYEVIPRTDVSSFYIPSEALN